MSLRPSKCVSLPSSLFLLPPLQALLLRKLSRYSVLFTISLYHYHSLPTPAPQGSGAVTPSTSSTQNKPATPAPATAHKPAGKLAQQPKKLTDAERGQLDLSTARTDYAKAQKEFKQAEDDLAAARKMRNQAMGELGLGNMDAGFRSPSGHRRRTHKAAAKPLSPTNPAQRTSQPAQPTGEKGSVNPDAGLKNGTPGVRPTTKKTVQTPKKLTSEERGRADLSTARTDYTKAQKEFKQAQSDLDAARKMEKQAMGEFGLGNINNPLSRRDLDVEDILESLAARGFFDQDDELFGRAPGSTPAPAPVRSTTRTPTKNATPGVRPTKKTIQTPKKLTSEERGRADLSTARTDYTKAQKEFKQARSDLDAARKMEKQAMGEFGLGNINNPLSRRDLDVEDILESLAARGFFDEADELFGRAPGSTPAPAPVRSTTRTPTKNATPGVRPTTKKTVQTPKKLTSEERGRADLSTARTDYTKAQKEFKQAQSDLDAARKMEKQAMGEFGLGNINNPLSRRDLDVEDILESLAARGFFDEDDELFGRAPGSTPAPFRSTTRTPAKSTTGKTPKKLTSEQRGRADLSTARNDYTKSQKEFKQAQSDLDAARKMEKQGLSEYGLGNLKQRDLDNVETLMEIIARGYYGVDDEY